MRLARAPPCAAGLRAAFDSLLTAARGLDPATRPDMHVGWGHGNELPASVAAVGLLDPVPAAL